jgi:hypothetical protein
MGMNFGARTVMQPIRTALALATLVACGAFASANAQQQNKPGNEPSKRPIIINDPSASRPPPQPRERNYVGPGPSIAPPMERVPQVAPLAQPPTR